MGHNSGVHEGSDIDIYTLSSSNPMCLTDNLVFGIKEYLRRRGLPMSIDLIENFNYLEPDAQNKLAANSVMLHEGAVLVGNRTNIQDIDRLQKFLVTGGVSILDKVE